MNVGESAWRFFIVESLTSQMKSLASWSRGIWNIHIELELESDKFVYLILLIIADKARHDMTEQTVI